MIDLYSAVEPIYDRMWASIENTGEFDMNNLSSFSAQVGLNYPEENNTGILFYGRATNSWDDWYHDPIEMIMQNQTYRPIYNLMHYFSWEFYKDKWFSHIAWSNICKVAPWKGGNPNNKLWDAQYPYLVEIIKQEVKLLSPSIVVLVTGNTASGRWDQPFFEALPGLIDKKISEEVWLESNEKKCTASLFIGEKLNVLLTDRPEARPIEPHAHALIHLLQRAGYFRKD